MVHLKQYFSKIKFVSMRAKCTAKVGKMQSVLKVLTRDQISNLSKKLIGLINVAQLAELPALEVRT